MSHQLFMALFGNSESAAAAARDLHALGVVREDLSVVAGNHQQEGMIGDRIDGSPGSEIEDSPSASRLGELGGYLLAAIAIGMPGTGALVAAGPLAAELGEVAGHVTGRVTGDLEGTLMAAGLTRDEAESWRTQIEAGALLLGVHARTANGSDVEKVLAHYSAGRVIHTERKED